MKLPALKITQNKKSIYLTLLTPEKLKNTNQIKADVWAPNNRKGYQRELEQYRARLFARWISDTNNISPTAVVLSTRQRPKFTSKDGPFGTLEIPDEAVLYEVDGQHRIGGIRWYLEKVGDIDFTLAAVIISPPMLGSKAAKDASFTEAKNFVVINRTQKRVRVDLSDRFLARLKPSQRKELEVLGTEEELEATKLSVEIVDVLRKKKGSVWKDNIKIPTGGPGIVSETTFVNSLWPIVTDDKFKGMSAEELADALDNYWSAFAALCPAAFTKPTDYEIQKSHGVYVLHMLFVDVAKWLISSDKELEKNEFKEVLDGMTKGVTAEYWYSRGDVFKVMGTGYKVFNEHYKALRDNFLAGRARSR